MSPIILVGAGILLLGLGLGLGYWFAHSQHKREATRANDVRNELDNYRRHVTEHFGETAQHFQLLGQQYQSLYKHMAQGADTLCDPAQSDTLLGFAAGNAPAIMASNDQPENPPEVIRDCAGSHRASAPCAELQKTDRSSGTDSLIESISRQLIYSILQRQAPSLPTTKQA